VRGRSWADLGFIDHWAGPIKAQTAAEGASFPPCLWHLMSGVICQRQPVWLGLITGVPVCQKYPFFRTVSTSGSVASTTR
jgi:hypothetical protein